MVPTPARSHRSFYRFIATALALFAAGALAGCANPNLIGVQDTGIVRGIVVDATTQLPVAGAYGITGGISFRTTPDGRFTLPTVPVSEHQTLTISAGGYASTSVDFALTKDQTLDLPTIALQPQP